MKRMPASVVLLGLSAIAPLTAHAHAHAQAPAQPPAPCSSEQAHQFDFWLGEWMVYTGPEGDNLAGRNRIERSANGCWLSEHWQGASGNHGTSLNAWDGQYQVWRQFWVGGDGLVLRLSGGLHEGSMVMTGEQPAGHGGVQRQRITWTPRSDGSVTQQWDTSNDDGKTWKTVFLGIYRHPSRHESMSEAPAAN